MVTMNESIRPEETDEEDELDGWGPVRVRRSSMPNMPIPTHSADAETNSDKTEGHPQPEHHNAHGSTKLMT